MNWCILNNSSLMENIALLRHSIHRRITNYSQGSSSSKTLKRKTIIFPLINIKHYQSFPFFQSIRDKYIDEGEECSTKLMQAMRTQVLNSDDCLFSAGDQIESLHIILKGEVREKGGTYRSPIRTEGYLFHHPLLTHYETEAYCLTYCQIGSIPLALYHSIIKAYDAIEKSAEMNFLSGLYAFSNSNQRTIEKIYDRCREKQCSAGATLFKQGEPTEGLYIIRKGQFELSRKYQDNILKSIDVHLFDGPYQSSERFSSIRQFELKDSYTEVKEMKVMLLGIGDFLGDVEMKNEHTDSSYFTVKCLLNRSIAYHLSFEDVRELFIQGISQRFYEGITLKENTIRARLLFLIKKKEENMTNKYNSIVLKQISHRSNSTGNILRSNASVKTIRDVVSIKKEVCSKFKKKKLVINASLFKRNELSIGKSRNEPTAKLTIPIEALTTNGAAVEPYQISSYNSQSIERKKPKLQLKDLHSKQLFLYSSNKKLNTDTFMKHINTLFPLSNRNNNK